jgi:hypothetical protein
LRNILRISYPGFVVSPVVRKRRRRGRRLRVGLRPDVGLGPGMVRDHENRRGVGGGCYPEGEANSENGQRFHRVFLFA